MKHKVLYLRMFFLSCILLALGLAVGSCSDDENEGLQAGYGYVQFKLYKSGSAKKTVVSRAGLNELDSLGTAQKMEIVLVNLEDGSEIIQTVGLSAMGNDSEFGLRSEKLQLMSGRYQVVGFYLYKPDEEQGNQALKRILSGEPEERTVIAVQDGGLAVQDIMVKVVERGMVKFTVTKNFIPGTRSVLGDDYLFSDIYYINVTVQDQFTKKTTSFQKVPVKYTEKLKDGKSVSVAVSDSLLRLQAGKYKIVNYTTWKKNKTSSWEYGEIEGEVFEVVDNKTTDVDVPINFLESTGCIKDYLVLKEIWMALKGPKILEKNQKGWSYSGTTYPIGANWDFDKDIDLWGQQPGVELDAKGRVTALSIGAFGPEGDIPECLCDLTELLTMSLGNHSDQVGDNVIEKTMGRDLTEVERKTLCDDYYNKYVKRDIKANFSDLMQIALKWQEEGKPEKPDLAALSAASVQSDGPSLKDVPANRLTNGIRGIPQSIGKLKNLQMLYIANGKFADFAEGTDLSALENLTDMELYNCPSMKRLPVETLKTLPGIQLLNFANNPQLGDFHEDLATLVSSEKISKSLQILYLSFNRLTVLPDMSMLEKLGKLDCIYNQIKTIKKAFGNKVNLVQLSMDYNQISELPRDENGSFCGYADVESFSFSHNKLKKFPAIFSSSSIYIMSSVDFSFNEIDGFEEGFDGINVNTLSLGGNKLTEFPGILFEKNSKLGALALAGNGIKEFPEGVLKNAKYSYMLKTLDLTYNKLSKFPKDFNGANLPFLYGLDISNNCFSEFPSQPLDAATLTVLGIRNQRDAQGNRSLRQWPTGIANAPSLSGFYIGGNDLRKIDDTISSRIFVFEIKDNPNIVIDLSSVCTSIKYGYYKLIYDKTQDIRGCDYLKE